MFFGKIIPLTTVIPTTCRHHQSQGFLSLHCHHELTRSDILARVGRRTDLQWQFQEHRFWQDRIWLFGDSRVYHVHPFSAFSIRNIQNGLDTWTSTISEFTVLHMMTIWRASARCQESWRDCPCWKHSLSEVGQRTKRCGPFFPQQLTIPENLRAS